MSAKDVKELADALGGQIKELSGPLSDGSGFAVVSFPLPKEHWIYAEPVDRGEGIRFDAPPMPFRMGTDDVRREQTAQWIRTAAKYAIRASTMNGKGMDFDPDAMVQNFIVGMLGYWTPNGFSDDEWANPEVQKTEK